MFDFVRQWVGHGNGIEPAAGAAAVGPGEIDLLDFDSPPLELEGSQVDEGNSRPALRLSIPT